MSRYLFFRAPGLGAGLGDYAGILPLLDAADRDRRGGPTTVYGARRIGDSIGFEPVGRLIRRGAAVELEGLEPADDGPGEGGPS